MKSIGRFRAKLRAVSENARGDSRLLLVGELVIGPAPQLVDELLGLANDPEPDVIDALVGGVAEAEGGAATTTTLNPGSWHGISARAAVLRHPSRGRGRHASRIRPPHFTALSV
jgi:hypothetical protein